MSEGVSEQIESVWQLEQRARTILEELRHVEDHRASLRKKMSDVDRRHATLCKERDRIARTIVKRSSEPSVSDHAILRYLERHEGLDVEAIKRKMLLPEVLAAIEMGLNKVAVDGHSFNLSGAEIVTYYLTGPEKRKRKAIRKLERLTTAEAIAAAYDLNPKSYRAALRRAGLAWHQPNQPWMVMPGSPEQSDMLRVAEAMTVGR
jgi:septal ring factor EnvC (AmiA/AmiB activator)